MKVVQLLLVEWPVEYKDLSQNLVSVGADCRRPVEEVVGEFEICIQILDFLLSHLLLAPRNCGFNGRVEQGQPIDLFGKLLLLRVIGVYDLGPSIDKIDQVLNNGMLGLVANGCLIGLVFGSHDGQIHETIFFSGD